MTDNTNKEMDFHYDDDNDYKRYGAAKPDASSHALSDVEIRNNEKYRESAASASWTVHLFSLCAALNSCNLGYDIGVNTSAGPLLQTSMDLSNVKLELFYGSLNLFSMVGAIFAHTVSDRFGRKGSLFVAAFVFIFGVMIIALGTSYPILMVGRVFVGLGVGVGFAIDPIYIAEISPSGHRGHLVTYSELFTNVGIVLGFSTSLTFINVDANVAWRYMFALGTILPFVLIILLCTVMPESPRWLVQTGKVDKAKEVLLKIYKEDEAVAIVLKDIQDDLKREREVENTVGWRAIFFPTPAFRRLLIVGIGTAMIQQLTGIDAIQYFLLFILQDVGINDNVRQAKVLIALGTVKLGFVLVSGFLFDKRGRRPLMLSSLLGCALSLLLLALYSLNGSENPEIAITCLVIYLSSFSLGMGPGAWLIPSEIFPTSIRAKAMSLATFTNRALSTLSSSTTLTFVDVMTMGGYFILLSASCLVCFLFLYAYLPETKGKALEDMALYFAEITGDRSILSLENTSTRDTANSSDDNSPERGILT